MAALFLLLAARVQAASPDISGSWLDDTGRAAITIEPCASGFCGRIAWLKEPLDPKTHKPKQDVNNPDPAQRTAPICGLEILWGFTPDGPGQWTDGKVYDPESGNVYSAEAAIEDPNVLRLHGYILVPLLGRTKLFSRATGPPKHCEVSRESGTP